MQTGGAGITGGNGSEAATRTRSSSPLSGAEVARLERLVQYQIAGTARELIFDDIARLAAQICRTPIALVSFLDDAREWVKGGVGWDIQAMARPLSLCATFLGGTAGAPENVTGELFLIADAREDARLLLNPHVTGDPHLRFYAAVPLLTPEGYAVGALAVLDVAPRLLDDTQAAALKMLAAQVVTHLENRRQVYDLMTTLTSRTRAEEQARWQARHDVLTGLPNRAMFLERVHEALLTLQTQEALAEEEAEAAGKRRKAHVKSGIAILFVDLDRFKRINDTLGHAAGDMLLREVAARFSGCLRPEDTLARLGGDEFTVLLPDIPNASYAVSVSQMLLRTLRRPVLLGAEELHVGASIGIAAYPRDGDDAQTLLKHADIAMYEAKAKGGYQAYSPRMNSDSYQRLIEEGELRRAIDKHELSLCYQPQVDLATGKILSVEALARWRHPERGLVPPAHFIALAEQADLIVPLGQWVLQQACADAARWRAAGHQDLRVAVNVSARQLSQPRLLDIITETLTEVGLDGSALDLELTETALCANGDSTPQVLQSLRSMGIRLFVDDFGTGYSSLAYLRRFAVDALKIDRAFIAGLGQNTPDDVLVRALIEMAHALDVKVIAEGVETPAQLERLRALTCDILQGYLFGRPVTLEGLLPLLASTQGVFSLSFKAGQGNDAPLGLLRSRRRLPAALGGN